MIADRFVVAGIMATVLSISAALAQDAPPHDLLLANLWLQRSVESRGERAYGLRTRPNQARPGVDRRELDCGPTGAEGRLQRVCRPRLSWTSTKLCSIIRSTRSGK